MNGIFGAGPADQDFEDDLTDRAWQPTFSEEAVARQWGLPAPGAMVPVPPAAPPVPVAPAVPMTVAAPPGVVKAQPVVTGKPPMAKPKSIVPSWLPWTLAVAGIVGVVYVISRNPKAPVAGQL